MFKKEEILTYHGQNIVPQGGMAFKQQFSQIHMFELTWNPPTTCHLVYVIYLANKLQIVCIQNKNISAILEKPF